MNIDKYIQEPETDEHCAYIHSTMREELYTRLRLLGATPSNDVTEFFHAPVDAVELLLIDPDNHPLFWHVTESNKTLLSMEKYKELINQ